MSDVGIPFPRLPDPLRCFVAGSSGSGKSTLICAILRDQLHVFGFEFDEILICYELLDPQFLTLSEVLTSISFVNGLPHEYIQNLKSLGPAELRAKKKLIILDDLITKIGKSPDLVTDLFIVGSSHLGLSVMLLTQNFYFKQLRTPSLNVNFVILMRMNRGLDQIKHIIGSSAEDADEKQLAKQAYKAAMSTATFGHFCIDLSFLVDPRLKYFTGILSSQARLYFLADKDAQRQILKP